METRKSKSICNSESHIGQVISENLEYVANQNTFVTPQVTQDNQIAGIETSNSK